MAGIRGFQLVKAAAITLLAARAAVAQMDETLEDHVWVGGTGNQQWQVEANWNPPPFPNDPGRMDPDVATISPVVGANLSTDLAADLNVDIGGSDITIASLTIGGTAAPVTTNVTAGGGRLVFENFELNNNTVPDNVICAFNCGAALITSQGVAGGTNLISAPVGVNDGLQITGARGLTLAGGLVEMSPGGTLSAISPGLAVLVTGNITTMNSAMSPGEEDVPLALNSSSMSQGTIDATGVISGPGRMQYGTADSSPTFPLGTVILRSNNTYGGRTIMSRGNVLLGHDNALGTADVKQQGPSAGSLQTGYNFHSNDDARVIDNNMIIAQWQTVKGEHSLEWAGLVYQDNARGWINLLPDGKTLTLSGGQFPNHTEEMPPVPGRILTFDGSGRTLITGGLHNEWSTETQTIDPGNYTGSFRFRGTGSHVVSGGTSTYSGDTIVQGGNVHFATAADLGNTAQIVSTSGAVGVDAGVAGIVSRLDASDRGGLMLGTAEYAMNLDFTGTLATAANMSLAAHESGSTYTGTITPANNTYRLGGGSGTLTLPNANQLTGARNLVVTNGGEVRLPANNNFTGTTSIIAKYDVSLIDAATRDTINFADEDNVPNDQRYVGTTLTATTIANGGSPSSIGSSSNAAANLLVQGSTLRYVGAATSTDRLFTIGTGGATIDASGTGPIEFTNTGTLGVDVAEARTGNVNAFVTGNSANDQSTIRNLASTDDLQPGMPIMSPGLPAAGDGAGIPPGTVVTRIVSATEVGISNPVGAFAFYNDTQITFGAAPPRALTLTGTNSGSNSLASVIGNAADGGVVGVTKEGDGTWVLTGNNTYTGETNVNGGSLFIQGNHTGAGATTVAAGASLGGTGTLGGDVVMEEGSTFVAQFESGAVDPLAIAGNFDLSAPANTLDVLGTGTGTSWVIATYTGMLTGTFESIASGYSVDYGTGMNSQVTLNLSGPTGVAGDYNQNGVVDAADYVLWRSRVGPGSLPNEGGISPDVVDDADYNFWRSRFGAMSGAGAVQITAAVPEPASVFLLCAAFGGFARVMFGRRRIGAR